MGCSSDYQTLLIHVKALYACLTVVSVFFVSNVWISQRQLATLRHDVQVIQRDHQHITTLNFTLVKSQQDSSSDSEHYRRLRKRSIVRLAEEEKEEKKEKTDYGSGETGDKAVEADVGSDKDPMREQRVYGHPSTERIFTDRTSTARSRATFADANILPSPTSDPGVLDGQSTIEPTTRVGPRSTSEKDSGFEGRKTTESMLNSRRTTTQTSQLDSRTTTERNDRFKDKSTEARRFVTESTTADGVTFRDRSTTTTEEPDKFVERKGDQWLWMPAYTRVPVSLQNHCIRLKLEDILIYYFYMRALSTGTFSQ